MLGGIANWHLVAPNLSLIAPLHFLNSSSFQCCFGTALLWVRTLCFPEWSPTQTPESTCFLQILAHKLKQKILTWYPHIAQILGSECWSHQAAPVGDRLHFHFSLSSIGEGNGNPLQCSCLENPRDGGAWWAAVYGVAQSRTLLKWLSCSSNWILLVLYGI